MTRSADRNGHVHPPIQEQRSTHLMDDWQLSIKPDTTSDHLNSYQFITKINSAIFLAGVRTSRAGSSFLLNTYRYFKLWFGVILLNQLIDKGLNTKVFHCVLESLTVVVRGLGVVTGVLLGVLRGAAVGVMWVIFVCVQSLSSAPSGQCWTPSHRWTDSIQPPGGGQENWPEGQTDGVGRVPENKYKSM